MKIIVEHEGKTLGEFTLLNRISRRVLNGRTLIGSLGGWDGENFCIGGFEIDEPIEELNLDKAKKGKKYLMQDGDIATYIGKDKELSRPYMFRVDDYIITRMKNGTHCKTCNGSVYPAIIEEVRNDF